MKATSVDISLTVSTCTRLFLYVKATLVDIPLTVSTSLSISKYKAKATLVGILLAALTMSRFDIFLLPTISRRFHYSFNKNDCLKNTLSTLVDISLTVSTTMFCITSTLIYLSRHSAYSFNPNAAHLHNILWYLIFLGQVNLPQ